MAPRDHQSKYDPNTPAEIRRLSLQGSFYAQFDQILLKAAFEKLPTRFAAIDLGCGWGDVTMDRLGNDPQIEYVLGFDRNRACVQAAQEHYGDKTHRFRVCDIESERGMDWLIGELGDYGKQPVLVFMSYLLMHLNDPTVD